ncbi:hypothetical protein [Streptosporangium nondiastaticum]|nr:hypothetical protein [Streptosporangium nondiastaticum]
MSYLVAGEAADGVKAFGVRGGAEGGEFVPAETAFRLDATSRLGGS